jgi:hypothetical protein
MTPSGPGRFGVYRRTRDLLGTTGPYLVKNSAILLLKDRFRHHCVDAFGDVNDLSDL